LTGPVWSAHREVLELSNQIFVSFSPFSNLNKEKKKKNEKKKLGKGIERKKKSINRTVKSFYIHLVQKNMF